MIFSADLDLDVAHRWWKNGDHPDDNVRLIDIEADDGTLIDFLTEGEVVRRYRHPDVDGTDLCLICAQAWDVHGWIDEGGEGITVHPGDWVVTAKNGDHYAVREGIFGTSWEVTEEHPLPAKTTVHAACKDCGWTVENARLATTESRAAKHRTSKNHAVDTYEIEAP